MSPPIAYDKLLLRVLAREQVFNGDYLKAGEFPERRIEHASTGSLFFIGAVGLANVTNKPMGDRYRHHVLGTCPSTPALAPTTDLRHRCQDSRL